MRQIQWLCTLFMGLVVGVSANADNISVRSGAKEPLECLNARIRGKVIDHTNNHGCDNRIWSAALCRKKDLYVYVPCGYDPSKTYPVIFWLHGLIQDEKTLTEDVVEILDRYMAEGKLPHSIIVCPDGSLNGNWNTGHSWFVNSPKGGRFEDFVMCDVWDFVHRHYAIDPSPDKHAIFGVSSGGGSAFTLAIRHKERFRLVVGLVPMVNPRYVDCHGQYRAKFDPNCWGFRERLHPYQLIGRVKTVIPVRLHMAIDKVYPRSQAIAYLSKESPTEMIMRGEIKPGELLMWVGYGGKDELGTDGMVESFLHVARCRGFDVGCGFFSDGKHDRETCSRLLEPMSEWLKVQQDAGLIGWHLPSPVMVVPAVPANPSK
jgi:enterochelin esterase-like enzyme